MFKKTLPLEYYLLVCLYLQTIVVKIVSMHISLLFTYALTDLYKYNV